MPRSTRRAGLASLVILLSACSQNYPNPFQNQQASATPAASDDLVFTSDSYATQANGLLEVYSLNSATGTPTRLTYCDTATAACSSLEAAFAPDRQRSGIRQVTMDSNGDGLLNGQDNVGLIFEDLSRGVQANLAPNTAKVNGVDWSLLDGVIVYSAIGAGGVEDLYRIDTNGQNNTNLTGTAGVRERRPRIDHTGTIAAFERIDSSGKGNVYIFDQNAQEVLVDSGGPGTDPLPGTPYVVGADADPTFSPDSTLLVFRRLTGTGNAGLGTWDILTVRTDGSGLTTVAGGGALYRGAPDWNSRGIVFVETDPSTQTSSIVLVAPDGSGRKTLLTATGGFTLAEPRWLPPI